MAINFLQKGNVKNLLQGRKDKHHKPDPTLLTFFENKSASPPAGLGHLFAAFSELLFPSAHLWGEALKSVSGLVFFSLPTSKRPYKRFCISDNEAALLTLPDTSAGYFEFLLFLFDWPLLVLLVLVVDPRTSSECPASLLQPDTGLWQCRAVLNTPRTSSPAFPPILP